MIKVTMGTTVKRVSDVFGADTTLRSALDQHGIDYTSGTMHLDGSPLDADDLDRTFADHGIIDKCFLLNVVKADNAA